MIPPAREAVTFALQQMRLAAAEAPVLQLDLSVTFPTVNRNGSDREALAAQQADICNAVEALHHALQAGFPHGRDYQLAPETYQTARAEAALAVEMVHQLRVRHQALFVALFPGA